MCDQALDQQLKGKAKQKSPYFVTTLSEAPDAGVAKFSQDQSSVHKGIIDNLETSNWL